MRDPADASLLNWLVSCLDGGTKIIHISVAVLAGTKIPHVAVGYWQAQRSQIRNVCRNTGRHQNLMLLLGYWPASRSPISVKALALIKTPCFCWGTGRHQDATCLWQAPGSQMFLQGYWQASKSNASAGVPAGTKIPHVCVVVLAGIKIPHVYVVVLAGIKIPHVYVVVLAGIKIPHVSGGGLASTKIPDVFVGYWQAPRSHMSLEVD